MVKILFFLFSYSGITDADGLFRIGRENTFDFCCVSRTECFTESVQRGGVFPGFLLESGVDLFGKDHADLLIGNYKFIGIQRSLFSFRQIACGEENTP